MKKNIKILGIIAALISSHVYATTEAVSCNPIPIIVAKKSTYSYTTYHTYKIVNTGTTTRSYKLIMVHWNDKFGGQYETKDTTINVLPGETYSAEHQFDSHFWGNLDTRGSFTLTTRTHLEDHKTDKLLKSISCDVPLKVI